MTVIPFFSDFVDIVNDPVSQNDYKETEDPKIFKSTKTDRGPLKADWIDELKKNQKENKIMYMCAYKLCRVECKIRGFQARIEKSVCESG